MILQLLSFLLPEFIADLVFVTFLLGLVGTVLLARWMGERRIKMKIERARTLKDHGLSEMEKLSVRYKCQHHDVDTAHIVSLSLSELVDHLKKGSLAPESVLHAYIEKAFEVNKELNCLTDFLPECEAQLQEVKKQDKGLLYGVPISLKDNVGYKGHDSHCGLVHFLGLVEPEDSVIVQVLKKQGAIPFVKTNIPQSMINFDCSNSIYGQTVNPHNHKKTCGGSSGGEAALIAGGGAILGVGTDVLGSIRMPCSFCGICGLKPSGNRLSALGFSTPVSGMRSAVMMPGPMARDVDSLALFMKAVLCDDMFQLDPTVPPVPFKDEVYNSTRPLTIGFYDTDGYFLPPPGMKRAIQETKALLEEAGHKLVPFSPPRIEYALNELCIKGFFADGGTTLVEKFNADIVDPNLKQQILLYKIPVLVKKIMSFFMRPVFPRIANHVNAHCGVGSVKELWKHNTAIKEYRCQYINEWRKLNMDALLCPMLGPAFNIGCPGKLFAGFCFTMLFNILNFPAGVLPVTTLTTEDEEELKHYKGYYNDLWDKEVIKGMEAGVGLPVAVQCVALPWQEEQCLRLMKEVETVTHGRLKNFIERESKVTKYKALHIRGTFPIPSIKNLVKTHVAIRQFITQNPLEDIRRILGMSLVELTENLRDGSLSPETVLCVYMEKALEVNKDLNCVTVFMSDCEAQLKEVKKQKQRGILYGVPISIKEHIGYQGHPSTCGLVQYLDEAEKEDSVIVKVLKKQGGIIFAKTNVSQSLMSYEASNSIYGQTYNPHNKDKSPAGSSSGEGALVGAGGSILGIGTDIGGSIRLPSSFCGIAGFKATTKRLSIHGMRESVDGLLSVLNSTGPMARDVDSLVLCMKALLCDEMFHLDCTVPPLPFNDEVYFSSKPLRIGYYDTDGFFLPNPGMRRVLLETKNLLEEAGHTLVPFTPPRIEYMKNELYMKSFLGDGGETLREKFKNNIVDQNLKAQVFLYRIPGVVKKMMSLILRPLCPRIARELNSTRGASSVKDHFKHQKAVQEYQTEFITEWRKLNLDVVLCPMVGPAYNIGYAGKLFAAISYTMLYNVLGFPAGVVPVSSVTKTDEEELKHYKGYYNDRWDNLFRKAVEDGLGLPLSVQCVALPYQDELCLRFMKEVETLSRRHQDKKEKS
ncbi:uncharacterized protein WCC33_009119 [Rhinophrynus dorsalis]